MTTFEAVRRRLTDILLLRAESTLFADVLDVLLEVFESEYGFFGYLNAAGDLVCPSMTRQIFALCEMPDKDIVFARASWGGLWGRVLLERRAQIKNEPHQVPQGHLPIHRSFGAPVLFQGELIGAFHLANRARDYDEADVALLEQTAGFIAPVLHARLRSEEEQLARLRVEAELRRRAWSSPHASPSSSS